MFHLLLDADVFTPEAKGRCNVLVAGGTIAWIGEGVPQLGNELQVSVHDLSGCRVVPGLIDAHAHLTGGGGENGFSSRVPPVSLNCFTAAGITSVVGVLGTDDSTRNTASLLAETRGLCEEGISAWCHTGGYHLPPVTLTGSVRGDIVHVDRIIGIGEVAISDHRSSQPSLSELLRIAADAHVAGLISAKAGIVHLHLGDGRRGLEMVQRALDTSEIPARVFNPTHVNRRRALFEEAVELATRGCTVDITAFPELGSSDEIWAHEALLSYLDSGAPAGSVTVSSDGGGCLPVFDERGEMISMNVGKPATLFHTLRRLLLDGHAPERILPAFTLNVANLLRLPHKGRLAPGADADLVVLDATCNIRSVMAAGRWHVRDGRQLIRRRIQEIAH